MALQPISFRIHDLRRGYELLKEWDVPVTYHEVASEYGHDAFLVEKEVPKFEPLIRSFLSNLPVKAYKKTSENFRGLFILVFIN